MKQDHVSPDGPVLQYLGCGENFYGTEEQRLLLCDFVLGSSLCKSAILCMRRFYHWCVYRTNIDKASQGQTFSNISNNAGFEVLTAVGTKSSAFWDITLCSLINII
jgi:hypothetical protein